MGRNYITVHASRPCPDCGTLATFQIALRIKPTDDPNTHQHNYKFECENFENCTYQSEIYAGPEVDTADLDSPEARKKSRQAAIESAKNHDLSFTSSDSE